MAGTDMTDEALVAFLRGHPDFRNRVASIALAMENADGDLHEADAAEERLVEEHAASRPRGASRLGREARGSDGAGNSSTTFDASPG